MNDDIVLARFMAKVNKCGDAACWLWTGAVMKNGYGRVRINGKAFLAHRAAYALLIGDIPDGMQIDHTCHTADPSCRDPRACPHRRCVNPAHLEPVTARENTLRSTNFSATNAQKTHCPAGHAYDLANTYLRPTGSRQRYCRTCQADRNAAATHADTPLPTGAPIGR